MAGIHSPNPLQLGGVVLKSAGNKSVIVIGAKVAGLTAAYELIMRLGYLLGFWKAFNKSAGLRSTLLRRKRTSVCSSGPGRLKRKSRLRRYGPGLCYTLPERDFFH